MAMATSLFGSMCICMCMYRYNIGCKVHCYLHTYALYSHTHASVPL